MWCVVVCMALVWMLCWCQSITVLCTCRYVDCVYPSLMISTAAGGTMSSMQASGSHDYGKCFFFFLLIYCLYWVSVIMATGQKRMVINIAWLSVIIQLTSLISDFLCVNNFNTKRRLALCLVITTCCLYDMLHFCCHAHAFTTDIYNIMLHACMWFIVLWYVRIAC